MQLRTAVPTPAAAPAPAPAHARRGATVDLAPLLDLPGDAGPILARSLTLGRGDVPALTRHPLLVLEGAVLQRVAIGRRTAAELLGPGDLLSVAVEQEGPATLSTRTLTDAAVAVVGLGRPRPPALDVALLRASGRRQAAQLGQRLLLQLPQLEDRLAALLPHLAERWGVVTGDGVLLPAFLRHGVLADLAGVRRPSFTTVAARLAEAGTLTRLDDGRWRVRLDLALGDAA